MDENKMELVPLKLSEEQKAAIVHNIKVLALGAGIGLVVGTVIGYTVSVATEDSNSTDSVEV